MNTIRTPVAIFVLISIALGAWFIFSRQQPASTFLQGSEATSTQTSSTTGLANPASVNCVQTLHGQLDIVNEANGQVGYCHLPDGRVCEEWSLMRGGCTPPQGSSATSTSTIPGFGLDPTMVAQNIVGMWQSTDDPNYSVVVTASGKWTDTYGGSATSSASETGTYALFTSANPDPDFTGVLVPGVVYLKVAEGASVLYYSVLEADGQNLQLSYLDRGNTLSFLRVQ